MTDADDRDRPWGFYLAFGALVLVAVGLLVVPGMLAPTPQPTVRPTPTQDPHVFETAFGTFTLGLEANALVVRRTDVSPPQVLGTTVLPDELLPTASGGDLNGSASFVLACPPAPGGSDLIRILFGHVKFGSGVTYSGPAADGHAAPDGLYLFAVKPGPAADTAVMDIKSSSGELGVQIAEFARVSTEGHVQSSGCHVGD